MLASIPVAWLLSRLLATPLRSLSHEARAVREFDFTSPTATRSVVAEVDELALSMNAMRVTIRNFLEIAAAVSAERHFQRLLDRILGETIAAAGSAAGAIYLFDDDHRTLATAALKPFAGTSSALPKVELDATLGEHPVWRAAAEVKTLVVPLDAQFADLARLLEAGGGERVEAGYAVIAVPLTNPQKEILGVVCLLNSTAESLLPRHLVTFVEALSGTAAIAIENQILLREQKELLDSLIRLIAGAIDAKSPYTGGHCQRVPEIATMLAKAACDASQGPFRDFTMNDDELETLHIAAWLHDCGKVTDTGVRRQQSHQAPNDLRPTSRRADAIRGTEARRGDRLLAASCRGGRSRCVAYRARRQVEGARCRVSLRRGVRRGRGIHDAETIERIRRIAQRTWLRTIDDRIGLSHEERMRAEKVPSPSLPVVEHLLADKPEHIIERSESDRGPRRAKTDSGSGCHPHKRNSGEIYNLCIGRGTLTDEERHVINDHVVQTIKMLSQLPFPKHLKSVPEIAGGHHEKLDGTGYPRQLRGGELSLSARILAIADIFEALTAHDRPYKTGRTLSQAIAIMASMSKARHIDVEFFELFLTAGVYRQYAVRFLEPAQIDEVDVAAHVGAARRGR